MRYPALFVNHGGGPLPLLGQQPKIVQHLQNTVQNHLPKEPPKAIVVISAHWEANPIRITSSASPSMYYDYSGFPSETYKLQYSAPGSPDLAHKVHDLLTRAGIQCQLDPKRGYDHGVFVPLMIMYPSANIPVVCVSLHPTLNARFHLALGHALAPLRDQGKIYLFTFLYVLLSAKLLIMLLSVHAML
jgi:4,5-DOPA dioxygenase extradiol